MRASTSTITVAGCWKGTSRHAGIRIGTISIVVLSGRILGCGLSVLGRLRKLTSRLHGSSPVQLWVVPIRLNRHICIHHAGGISRRGGLLEVHSIEVLS